MAKYKGKYYKPDIVKAKYEYECPISNEKIQKGEYYLHLDVEDTSDTRVGLSYIPKTTFRISKKVFAEYSMEQILDKTGFFETLEEKLQKCQEENKVLITLLMLLTLGTSKL